MRRRHDFRSFGPGPHDFVVFYFEVFQDSFEYTFLLKISPLYHFNLLNKKEALKRDSYTLHTYTLLMLPKWVFQLNRIKKYKYIN